MKSSGLTCIVDDNPDFRILIHHFFTQSCPQHSILLFASGQALLDALPQMSPPPSLILLDRHMPGLDGHQTLELLKQHPIYKRIPVVMISAQASRKEIDGCYESGVNSFLSKNPDFTSLQEALSTVCRYWLDLNLIPSAL
ncbi:response regulator [Spirosoma endophyticum]|uniref:Response regulator receiver domain-containing protein n=1 Tax=Spirosoma endophyticum TaxID=662367 RepID=A0A1I2HKQ6_9BACT|nr:response regulator [Spirosoma endophyticum]SFF29437.1 Response regulator receiver domain-containing protein [Spirosoma endophyticum]